VERGGEGKEGKGKKGRERREGRGVEGRGEGPAPFGKFLDTLPGVYRVYDTASVS